MAGPLRRTLYADNHTASAAIIVHHEACGMGVLRPIELKRSEPLGKQSDHSLRKVNVVSKNPANWRQTEAGAKCVEWRSQLPIYHDLSAIQFRRCS